MKVCYCYITRNFIFHNNTYFYLYSRGFIYSISHFISNLSPKFPFWLYKWELKKLICFTMQFNFMPVKIWPICLVMTTNMITFFIFVFFDSTVWNKYIIYQVKGIMKLTIVNVCFIFPVCHEIIWWIKKSNDIDNCECIVFIFPIYHGLSWWYDTV